MNKIKGIGIPFSCHQSSCSNRKPKTFSWTEDDCEIEVWVDSAISQAINLERNPNVKRYAWLCESRAIIPQIRNMFKDEDIFNSMVNSFDGIFTCENELVEMHEKIHFCLIGSNLPWIQEYKIHDKSKLVSFIASHKLFTQGHYIRHELYKSTINNKIDIDVYGSITGNSFGHNPGCHLDGIKTEWHDKREGIMDYMFSVVIENDQYDTYFTEKITDCFATGTIPVYWGTKNIGDYFNTDGIIFLEGNINEMQNIICNLNESLYNEKIDAIEDNLKIVKKLQSADDMLYEKIK
jgi:hypothetical protein